MGLDIGSITKAASNPASLFKSGNKPLKGKTHPYDHATKLYIADGLKLAPKNRYLYYVSINIGVGAQTASGILDSVLGGGGGGGVSSLSLIQQYEAGMLVKSVDLPKFSMDVKTINSYNKKNIVQTAIKYEPISITFHDDSADIVTRLWNDYYTYYYRDSDYSRESYQQHHINTGIYAGRTDDRWGYTIRNAGLEPFLRNIQIFSLHNKRFTEYTLINPYITSWRHGTHSAEAGNDIMENTMTIMYETVKYKTGAVNAIDVNGFGTLHYDNTASPISGGGMFGQIVGGIAESALGGGGDLARPDGSENKGSIFSQIAGAAGAINALGGVNLAQVGAGVLGKIGGDALKGATNGISIPSLSDVLKGAGEKISKSPTLSKLSNKVSGALQGGLNGVNVPTNGIPTGGIGLTGGAGLNAVPGFDSAAFSSGLNDKLQNSLNNGNLASIKNNFSGSIPGVQNMSQLGFNNLVQPTSNNLIARGTTGTGGGFINGGYGSVGTASPSVFAGGSGVTPNPSSSQLAGVAGIVNSGSVSAFSAAGGAPPSLASPNIPTDEFFI